MYKKNELYHHGIKGQKWGVRRFQNSDGTLTPKGQKRYAKQIQNKEEAIKKLKKFKTYAEEDSVRSMDRYNKFSNKEFSKKEITKKLEEDFGKGDTNYWNKEARMYGYDSADKYAIDELNHDKKRALDYSKEAKEFARRCDALVDHYSKIKITDLTKEENKSLKSLAKAFYADGDLDNKFSSINVEYSKIANR